MVYHSDLRKRAGESRVQGHNHECIGDHPGSPMEILLKNRIASSCRVGNEPVSVVTAARRA